MQRWFRERLLLLRDALTKFKDLWELSGRVAQGNENLRIDVATNILYRHVDAEQHEDSIRAMVEYFPVDLSETETERSKRGLLASDL